MSKFTTLQPRLNEKTYGLSTKRVFVFNIDKGANKHTVARAVEAQFDVKVLSVNIVNIPGKAKRIISISGKRSRNATGSRSDIKKAYVTLAEGNSLPFFNAIEEADEKEQATQQKIDKAAAKQANKDMKNAKEDKPQRRGLRRNTKAEETK
jgi:large subunit ribosomal protein L23